MITTTPHFGLTTPISAAIPLLVVALTIVVSPAAAQMRILQGDGVIELPIDPRDELGSFYEFPVWDVDPAFVDDIFTFARLRFRDNGRAYYGPRMGQGKWRTDYPDSDLNISFRLHQLTALEVNPHPVIIDIEPDQLRHYPFVYMIEPGNISLTTAEAKALRDYLLNGGFIMVDDFWSDAEWRHFENAALQKIFPDRGWFDLGIDHEIFHCIFDIDEYPQVPALGDYLNYGTSWPVNRGPDCKDPHYRAIKDDEGRICMVICHNTDLGDGWEREGENEEFFRLFAEPQAFPMGINIIFYAMTH